MIQLTPQRRIFLATPPVDCRQGSDGLAAGCRQVRRDPPLEGAVYGFRNRSGTARKLLLYNGQGYWRMRKRLSPGRFAWWPQSVDAQVPLAARERIIVRWHGNPEQAHMAQDWRRVAEGGTRLAGDVQGNQAEGSAKTAGRCSCHATKESKAFTPACRQGAMRRVSTLAM
jgi:transposase